jgi:hypothetical protein
MNENKLNAIQTGNSHFPFFESVHRKRHQVKPTRECVNARVAALSGPAMEALVLDHKLKSQVTVSLIAEGQQ